jgi:hypothetical protein
MRRCLLSTHAGPHAFGPRALRGQAFEAAFFDDGDLIDFASLIATV